MSSTHLIPLVEAFGQSRRDPHNDFFDQFLAFDTVNVDSPVALLAPESTLLTRKMKGAELAGEFTELDQTRHHSAQDTRGVPRKLNLLKEAPTGNLSTSEESGEISSGFEYLSLENVSLQLPRTKPPSSSPKMLAAQSSRGRRQYLERSSKPPEDEAQHESLRRSSPIGKATCPTMMMQIPQFSEQNIPSWDHRLALDTAKFDSCLQHKSCLLSPPPAARMPELSDNNNGAMATAQQHDGTFIWDGSFSQQLQQYTCQPIGGINSPLTTPPSDITNFQQSNLYHKPGNSTIYTTTHSSEASTSWVRTPVTSQYNSGTPMTHYLEQDPITLWWGNEAELKCEDLSNCGGYLRLNPLFRGSRGQCKTKLENSDHEASSSPTNFQSSMTICMPSCPNQQSYCSEPSPIIGEEIFPVPDASNAAASPLSHRAIHYVSNYTLPEQHEKPKLLSRMESSSTSPRLRAASSSHVSKKSFSRKRTDPTGGTNRTLKTGNGTGIMVNFVNFTPNDSIKILTGVAPSGSSKTKARREKEAIERNRRLSQAALRAVQAAGGSIEGLMEEGLFIQHLEPGE